MGRSTTQHKGREDGTSSRPHVPIYDRLPPNRHTPATEACSACREHLGHCREHLGHRTVANRSQTPVYTAASSTPRPHEGLADGRRFTADSQPIHSAPSTTSHSPRSTRRLLFVTSPLDSLSKTRNAEVLVSSKPSSLAVLWRSTKRSCSGCNAWLPAPPRTAHKYARQLAPPSATWKQLVGQGQAECRSQRALITEMRAALGLAGAMTCGFSQHRDDLI